MTVFSGFQRFWLPAFFALLLLAGCSTTRIPQKGDKVKADLSSYWKGDGKEGKRSIVVKLSKQRAYYYINGHEVGASPIASGRSEFPTSTGSYQVIQKVKDYQSNQYGDFVDAGGRIVKKDVDSYLDTPPPGSRFQGAKMPFFMRVNKGVGFHAGYVPGYAASHGCLRLPPGMAKIFFSNTPVGTPVSIVP
jgi:lipoprotein-anchoring transpeptidase ErfK/SrfK